MKLATLDPEWLVWKDVGVLSRLDAGSLEHADGIIFLCPKCYAAQRGSAGVHSVICWFEGRVPDEAMPGPGRWTPRGTGFHDLTFVPSARSNKVSVWLKDGCGWHGFIKNGDAT